MESNLFSRGSFNAQGHLKIAKGHNGDPIAVDPWVFVATVQKVRELVQSATTPSGRLAVRVLQDLCLAYRAGGRSIRYDSATAEILAGFIITDGYTTTLRVVDRHEPRIILDAIECSDFMSAPRMKKSILDHELTNFSFLKDGVYDI